MQTTLVTDNFNRADANPVGGSWSTLTGQTAMQLVTNRLRGASTASRNGALYAGTFSKNQFAQAELAKFDVDAGGYSNGVFVRGSLSAETAYYSGFVDGGFGVAGYRLAKFVAGAQTDLASTTATIAANGVVKSIVNYDRLSGFVNDVLIATATDTAILSGQPGLGINLGAAVGQCEWDNFAAGNFEEFLIDYTGLAKPPIFEAALRGEM